MTTIKELSTGRSDLFKIDPRNVHIKEGWNVRQETQALVAHISWLADSITEIGVQQPITVYMDDGRAFVSDGHNRLRACMLAIERGVDIKSIPAILEDRYGSEADRVASMVTRNSGLPLTPLEKSEVYKRLYNLGWKPADISRKCGVSQAHVGQLLGLSAAPEEVKEAVRAGEISATNAVALVRDEGAAAAVEKVKKAREKGEKIKKTEPKAKVSRDIEDILGLAHGVIRDLMPSVGNTPEDLELIERAEAVLQAIEGLGAVEAPASGEPEIDEDEADALSKVYIGEEVAPWRV